MAATILALPSRRNEAKRPTDDGMIWPFARAEMRDEQAIIARMGEDMHSLIARGSQEITERMLLAIGWREAQVREHALKATRRMGGLNNDGTDVADARGGLRMTAAAFATRRDPARFDVLGEDIASSRAAIGRHDIGCLLALGWSLGDLMACDDVEVRALAHSFEAECEKLDRAAIGVAIAVTAIGSLIQIYGLFGHFFRGLA